MTETCPACCTPVLPEEEYEICGAIAHQKCVVFFCNCPEIRKIFDGPSPTEMHLEALLSSLPASPLASEKEKSK